MDPLFAKLDLKTSCRALADLLMPRLCIVCGRPLNLREDYICMGCEMDFPYTHFWESTHNAMADEFNARIVVPEGVHERYCYAAALFFYNSVSGYRNIPRQLKYNFRIAQGRVFARRLGEALAGSYGQVVLRAEVIQVALLQTVLDHFVSSVRHKAQKAYQSVGLDGILYRAQFILQGQVSLHSQVVCEKLIVPLIIRFLSILFILSPILIISKKI